jgi:hypothetical protein
MNGLPRLSPETLVMIVVAVLMIWSVLRPRGPQL